MVICLERGADLHTAQLMLLPLTVSCFNKIQIGFTFLVPADPGSPGQRAVKRVCVFLLHVSIRFHYLDHLVANRMTPSISPDPRATRWGSWFQAILYDISAYFCRIFGVCAVRIFFTLPHLTCLIRSQIGLRLEFETLVSAKYHVTRYCPRVRLQTCLSNSADKSLGTTSCLTVSILYASAQ